MVHRGRHSKKARHAFHINVMRVLGVLFLVVGLGMFGCIAREYSSNRNDNTTLQKTFKVDSIDESQPSSAAKDTLITRLDFKELKRINADIIGWVYIPGTHINYPILKAPDNEFYLTHNYKREKASCGSIFMNAQDDLSQSSHWVFGHHMRDNTMFADIAHYTDKQFARSHQKAYVILDRKHGPVAYTLKFDHAQSLKGDSTPPKLNKNVWALSTCGYAFGNQRIAAYFKVVDTTSK